LGQLLKKLGGYIGILQMEGDIFLKHTSQGSTVFHPKMQVKM
jgi:hypothetical protein